MKKCAKCGLVMVKSSLYDPDGTIPLVGGLKECNEDDALREWWVCNNSCCVDGAINQGSQMVGYGDERAKILYNR